MKPLSIFLLVFALLVLATPVLFFLDVPLLGTHLLVFLVGIAAGFLLAALHLGSFGQLMLRMELLLSRLEHLPAAVAEDVTGAARMVEKDVAGCFDFGEPMGTSPTAKG